jgi:hypothetical protein
MVIPATFRRLRTSPLAGRLVPRLNRRLFEVSWIWLVTKHGNPHSGRPKTSDTHFVAHVGPTRAVKCQFRDHGAVLGSHQAYVARSWPPFSGTSSNQASRQISQRLSEKFVGCAVAFAFPVRRMIGKTKHLSSQPRAFGSSQFELTRHAQAKSL